MSNNATTLVDTLRRNLLRGEEPTVTPDRDVTFVHATQRPVDGPSFGKNPRVARQLNEVGAELIYVHGNRATTLANIEKQQSALRMARSGEAGGIQQHAIIEADQA